MINFAEITINDKATFDKYLSQYNTQVSELTFTNLFMWRNYYKIRFAVIEDYLCIISVPEENEPFAFTPIGEIRSSLSSVVAQLKEYFAKNGWVLKFKRVSSEELNCFKDIVKSDDQIIYDRDNSDYVYAAENLISLRGKKYDGKRNHISRFKREHQFEYEAIDSSNIMHCYTIMDEWCAERSCEEHRSYYCEKLANTELLENYDVLQCKGALIKVDGEYKAFTVGEMLNNDTAVIHIEKASSKINGLYTLVNQQFCENEWQNAAFINREQDLGIEGLRKAKLSYNPAKIIEKYTVVI